MNEFKNAVYKTAISQLKQKEALLAEERTSSADVNELAATMPATTSVRL